SGKLSAASQETLSVIGLDEDLCAKDVLACQKTLEDTAVLPEEQRLSALSELWVKTALGLSPKPKDRDKHPMSEAALDAWLEAARYAYAYLFFSGRTPSDRAFEDRQTQVRDYYNYAAEQTAAVVFKRARESALEGEDYNAPVAGERWTLTSDFDELRMASIPTALVSASSLSFAGLRSTY
ncbi:MAG: alpha/beta hydrolase, partial [Stenotrophomonas sp.]